METSSVDRSIERGTTPVGAPGSLLDGILLVDAVELEDGSERVVLARPQEGALWDEEPGGTQGLLKQAIVVLFVGVLLDVVVREVPVVKPKIWLGTRNQEDNLNTLL